MALKRNSPEDFWRAYEEKTGEQIRARSLGRYVSGWDEFDDPPGYPLWGLVIATSGGFRFHHFPDTNWLSALMQQGAGGRASEEKTIFIPGEAILSAVLYKETKWYRKLFFPSIPRLTIRYRDKTGTERELLLYIEHQPDGIAEALAYTPK